MKPETQKLLEDAAEALARRGAHVEEVTLPPDFEGLEDVHRWISGFEMARNLTWEFEHHWNEISETFRNGRVKDGLECPYEKYVEMRIHMHHCRKLCCMSSTSTTCFSPHRRKAKQHSAGIPFPIHGCI